MLESGCYTDVFIDFLIRLGFEKVSKMYESDMVIYRHSTKNIEIYVPKNIKVLPHNYIKDRLSQLNSCGFDLKTLENKLSEANSSFKEI